MDITFKLIVFGTMLAIIGVVAEHIRKAQIADGTLPVETPLTIQQTCEKHGFLFQRFSGDVNSRQLGACVDLVTGRFFSHQVLPFKQPSAGIKFRNMDTSQGGR